VTPDDLYTLDPEDFVAARDELVRDLRKSDPDAAKEVAKLRRPTVAAWAVNTVSRAHPGEIEALLDAGKRLRKAQEKALGGDAGALRAATEERRTAVATVADLVAEVLGDRAPAQAGAVSATLEAATVDEEVAELVRTGRLDKERSAAAAGFGFGDVEDWTPPEKAPARPKRDDGLEKELAAATREAKHRAEALHEAEERVKRLKEELADATKAVRDARTKAQRAELQVEQLRQRAWEEGERSRSP
jgi:hypothetical protein